MATALSNTSESLSARERSNRGWAMKNRLAVIVGIFTLALFALGTASGQESDQENAPNAEPSSGVARISLIHGDVSTQRGDSGDWTAAALNQPVMTSDKVSTSVRSRA